MKARRICIAVVYLGLAAPVGAHRLDEYLQATTIAVDKSHVSLQLDLTPGVDVAQQVLAGIDTNGDGIISPVEQRAYVERVLRDLSVTIDGHIRQLRPIFASFPPIGEMRQGIGDIRLAFAADLPSDRATHSLTLENHHERAIAVYLVNCLLPRDPDIHVLAQDRTYDQSSYRLDFTSGAAPRVGRSAAASSALRRWLDRTAALSVTETYFWHGVHHILTGYDHLLFVSALVLGAVTLWDLVKLVTAFTVAHSITLTLAALNLVHVPESVVEPLISASIVFVALQNIFWPEYSREAGRLAAAFFFGLFHGLGFAGGLLDLMRQMPQDTVLLAILGFSLGVEAGNQMVLLPLFGLLRALRRTQADAAVTEVTLRADRDTSGRCATVSACDEIRDGYYSDEARLCDLFSLLDSAEIVADYWHHNSAGPVRE